MTDTLVFNKKYICHMSHVVSVHSTSKTYIQLGYFSSNNTVNTV